MQERVTPIAQTGVGVAEISAGVAVCTTGLGCTAGGVLITNGMDDVATGGYNYGQSPNKQTASLALTKGMGLSENTAANVKLGADVVTGMGAGAVVKSGKYATSSTKAAKNSETYFRVEGGGVGNKTSQNRILVNSDGTITINPGCTGQLCVSTLGSDHAKYYLSEKRPGGQVVVFEVNAETHKKIIDSLVPQKPLPGTKNPPHAPKLTDDTTPGTSIELPKVWNKILEENSSKARVLTEEQFFKEFGYYEKK